jgi:aminomethyltransferase
MTVVGSAATSGQPDVPLSEAPKRTPLHALHLAQGAKMVPFAGYDMPIQYPSGILKEHLHTRAAASLFDVSHMGQVLLRPLSGTPEDVAKALERLVPVDVCALAPGRQRYAMFTNAQGGILADLMIGRPRVDSAVNPGADDGGDHFMLVVNASRKDEDTALLAAALAGVATVERRDDLALIALQGPLASGVLASLNADVETMTFMDLRRLRIGDADCLVTRGGYTGEDGFEISMPAAAAEAFVRRLLDNPAVQLAGLGARDSLRLEAGLCLYGSDIDETTTPVEAGLTFAIQKSRRTGGSRAGGFPGADIILRQLAEGPRRKRVGLKPLGRAPVRGGVQLYDSETATTPIGLVTSGGFGPSVDAPVAMGYVDAGIASSRPTLHADVRGRRLPVAIVDLPFTPHRYRR